MRSRIIAAVALLAAIVVPSQVTAQAPAWPTRTVKFIVPFGPGAGADIGARLFAEKLTALWGQPVVIENKPGGDSIVAIKAFLSANDDHTLLFGPSGNFTVHPSTRQARLQPGRPGPDRARVHHAVGAVCEGGCALQERRRVPTRCQSGQVQLRRRAGITEFTFWGYVHHESCRSRAPYRDINISRLTRRGRANWSCRLAIIRRRSTPAASVRWWSTTRPTRPRRCRNRARAGLSVARSRARSACSD